MKTEKIKNFLKKSIASITLAIFGLSMFVPLSHAQETNTEPIGAKWYNSSLDKTFFEIPPDDRNLEDFIFTDQKIQYRNWTDNTDSWISENAKITSSMIWYNNYIDVKDPGNGMTVLTNREISNFFVVVNNKYYNTDGEFSFYLDRGSAYKIHTYWEVDEDQNYCLYLDLNNKGQEKYKIKNSCHMKLLDREPFLLFFQIEREGFEKPSRYNEYDANFNPNVTDEPYYRISVTLPYLITHEEKKYVTFHKAESFMFSSLYEKYKIYPSQNTNILLELPGGGFRVANSFNTKTFNRRGNQQAFRPYSFSFLEDYHQQDQKLKSIAALQCRNGNCQISLPVEGTSYFESFVLSVAAQYYNSPVVTNDKTYIGVPPTIIQDGFKPLEYENCDTLAIGCHIGNLGKSIHNTFGKIFSTIWNGFADIIKSIFTWVWEGIKTFLSPIFTPILEFFKPLYTDIVQPVWQFFWSFFDPLWKVATGKTDVHSFLHGDQNRICALQTGYYVEHNAKWNEKPAEFFQMLFFLANPKLPADNSQICTSLGMKQVQYGKNTLLDTTLFLIFFATGIWFSLFIIRPR